MINRRCAAQRKIRAMLICLFDLWQHMRISTLCLGINFLNRVHLRQHLLLAGCLWFSSSSLLLWFWLLLAFARPLLPLLPLISYTTCPLPLCVGIAPFFFAFSSFPYEPHGASESRLTSCTKYRFTPSPTASPPPKSARPQPHPPS